MNSLSRMVSPSNSATQWPSLCCWLKSQCCVRKIAWRSGAEMESSTARAAGELTGLNGKRRADDSEAAALAGRNSGNIWAVFHDLRRVTNQLLRCKNPEKLTVGSRKLRPFCDRMQGQRTAEFGQIPAIGVKLEKQS